MQFLIFCYILNNTFNEFQYYDVSKYKNVIQLWNNEYIDFIILVQCFKTSYKCHEWYVYIIKT